MQSGGLLRRSPLSAGFGVQGEKAMTVIGVISDTHNLLRNEAVSMLQKSDLILHAGDIGSEDVISKLAGIAPVKAVRGNIDRGSWASKYPENEAVQVEGIRIYMLHKFDDLDFDPVAAGFQVVISGHSHKPSISEIDGITYLNPGSAGPRRFTLPICLAKVVVKGKNAKAEIIHLDT